MAKKRSELPHLPYPRENSVLIINSHNFGAPSRSRQYTAASSQYHSIADNAVLSVTDEDFFVACFFYADSASNFGPMVFKFSGAGGYILRQRATARQLQFVVPGSNLRGNTFALDQWNFAIGWHDSVANTANVKLNANATVSASFTGGTSDSPDPFYIGGNPAASQYFDGRIARACFGKSPPGGITAIAETIASTLYNAGKGKRFEDLASSEVSDFGIKAYWNLEEPSGNAIDAVGGTPSLELTDNNGVTSATGP
jgi:hypothetical protein